MLSHVLTSTTRFVRSSIDNFNARHPWSHNDAFHPWIFTQLPNNRARALDVGCGHGVLVAKLAKHFEHVHGIDPDSSMRRASIDHCAGLSNVTIDGTTLADASPGFDLITMVAVLHHMDLITGLQQVRDNLAEGGRFLCVGLAHSDSMADHVWDIVCALTNPLIGFIRHPRPNCALSTAPLPTRDPDLSIATIRTAVDHVLPGARVRRRLAFRHTIEWTKPAPQQKKTLFR
ncbi:class I SAM-dependent methyltransferase [Corynebacterium macclintockiae]|uniref:class I SAM-dependent methyltransferase n=1 Tax=Corynebacterium macclintockiae TaxID=2913501 RepID=UPI003EB7095C